jgi:hypothetical protein
MTYSLAVRKSDICGLQEDGFSCCHVLQKFLASHPLSTFHIQRLHGNALVSFFDMAYRSAGTSG